MERGPWPTSTGPAAPPPPGERGLMAWDGVVDEVFTALDRALTTLGRTLETDVLRFPPVMPRQTLERSGFADSFPQLFGSVHAFSGDRARHQALARAMDEGADWGGAVHLTDYVLTPAACYPVYPRYSGELAPGGATVDVLGFCFRHEPSVEPGRLVSFRQREFVRIAHPDDTGQWFDQWQETALHFARSLGLKAGLEVAADPFYGPGGRLLSASQREQNLKYEIVAPIEGHPVAIASCNNHRDHFGQAFGIRSAQGGDAHTACTGFGMERIVLALLSAHGPVVGQWPDPVRDLLWS